VADPTSMNARRPYAPSWLNRLGRRIEALPVPSMAVYLVVGVVAAVLSNSQYWISGSQHFPNLSVQQSYWGALAGGLLALFPYLDRVATSALEAFKPALERADVDLDALHYELTVIPARPALVVTGLAIFATLMGILTDPASSDLAGAPPAAFVDLAAGESLVLSLMFLLMYHTLRQLRAVARIHALAPHVNLFRPAPLYAFSQLTVRTAIAFVAIVSTTLLINLSNLEDTSPVITVPFIVGGIAVAAAAFVVPLLGMHRRISAEKKDLEWQVGRRLEATTSEVHRAADARDLSNADGLNKLLGSLIAEREMLARLPTWPWQAGTVGAFVTALLLPIVLFLVTRALERLV
jgi:hypothetical protein